MVAILKLNGFENAMPIGLVTNGVENTGTTKSADRYPVAVKILWRSGVGVAPELSVVCSYASSGKT